jgi:UDP-N-acetylmuramoyl-L-alanyl-D-glutamate--2,6-diaminopimelate ligase
MPAPEPAPPLRPRRVTARSLAGLCDHLGLPPQAVLGRSTDVWLGGVAHAAQSAQAGDLYAALPGARTHGARFVGDAAERGAVAVLTDAAGADLAGARGLPTVVTDDPRARLGQAAAFVYGFPAHDMTVVGVTGTNGKTTVTSMLHAVLTTALGSCGLVGTIQTRLGDVVVPSVRTTPEASDLQAILATMRERGITACALEVSSHALALGRVGGLVVDVAGFTNLSLDHQDFHPDMEHYFATKASLFTPERSRRGVVVVDDDWGRRLVAQSSVPVQTVAADPDDPHAPDVLGAHWSVSGVEPDAAGSAALLRAPDGVVHHLRVPMPGLVNVANGALTVALATECGVDTAAAVAALADAPMVPGRMELVSAGQRPVVVVDYAHSPDALRRALATLRASSPSPLVVVIGAGGDRDRGKRAPMGAVAAEGADVVVVTDDNPRSEDPAQIRAAVLAGAHSVAGARVHEVADRAEAIEVALAHAAEGTVLVAGKGHEQGQEVAGVLEPFDDRVVARAALARAARPSRAPEDAR